MINKRLFQIILLALITIQVRSQTKLETLINYALENSREVKMSEMDISNASHLRKEVLGNGLPQATANASYSKMMFKLPSSLGQMLPSEYSSITNIDELNSMSAGLQVTQLIYSQSFWVGLNSAKKAQELYSVLKTKTEEDVIFEVANGYYQANSLILQMNTLDKTIKNLSEILAVVQLHYNNDLIKETELSRLKVNITNIKTSRKMVEDGLKAQLNYLKVLCGMSLDSSVVIDTLAYLVKSPEVGISQQFKVESVSAFQALQKQEELAKLDIKQAWSNYIPNAAAYWQMSESSYNTTNDFSSWNMMNTVGVKISIPVFTSGVNHSKVKQADIKHRKINEKILQTKDLLKIAFDDAKDQYTSALEQLEFQKENKELANKVYNQIHLQYQEGMVPLSDLLNANSDYLQADNSYNQQMLKCKTSELKILKASGNLKQMISNKFKINDKTNTSIQSLTTNN